MFICIHSECSGRTELCTNQNEKIGTQLLPENGCTAYVRSSSFFAELISFTFIENVTAQRHCCNESISISTVTRWRQALTEYDNQTNHFQAIGKTHGGVCWLEI